MTFKIVKTTSKGQITLPQVWRNKFKTDDFLIRVESHAVIITPVDIKNIEQEEVIFDAERDNRGKGVTPEKMIKLLKKIRHE